MERPYIIKEVCTTEVFHNPNYGENRTCNCGHPYHRHFDVDDKFPSGCKYCGCFRFIEHV